MVSKKFLLWLNVVLFLGLILLLLTDPSYEKAELYDNSLLGHFGMTQENIIDRYGTPTYRGSIGGPGGEVFFYEDINISFIFAGEGKIVNNLEVFDGVEVLGAEVGMTFDDIEEVLGEPRDRGFDHYSEVYTLVYFIGDESDGMGEVEIWFSADSDFGETKKAEIFWKKYWELTR